MTDPNPSKNQSWQAGIANRRRVLGDAWVDKAQAGSNPFNAEFQDLITRYAWQEVWGRPALGDKARRLMVLSTMIALAAWEEFEMHVRAALSAQPDSRLTALDLKEVITQAAIYCGVPKANHAFKLAGAILAEQSLLPQRPVLHLQTQGPTDAPWVVLAHALGCDSSMYDAAAAELAKDHQVLCYDHRGHGKSERRDEAFSINDLADDAADLIRRKCGGKPVVFAGVSLGGMTAQALAARHPSLVRGIVVANSSQHYPDEAKAGWVQRIAAVQSGGLQAIADGAMQRWFSADFRAAHAKTVDAAKAVLLHTDAANYIRACEAVMHLDARAGNAAIRCPALVIDGSLDEATPPAMSDAIAAAIPQAQRASLQTGHLGACEDANGFSRLVREFVKTL